jgi:hypothetical protein
MLYLSKVEGKTREKGDDVFAKDCMTSEITELMKIALYLLLSLGGGIMIAVLGILLIIVIGAVGAWLVHTLLRPRSGQIRV